MDKIQQKNPPFLPFLAVSIAAPVLAFVLTNALFLPIAGIMVDFSLQAFWRIGSIQLKTRSLALPFLRFSRFSFHNGRGCFDKPGTDQFSCELNIPNFDE